MGVPRGLLALVLLSSLRLSEALSDHSVLGLVASLQSQSQEVPQSLSEPLAQSQPESHSQAKAETEAQAQAQGSVSWGLASADLLQGTAGGLQQGLNLGFSGQGAAGEAAQGYTGSATEESEQNEESEESEESGESEGSEEAAGAGQEEQEGGVSQGVDSTAQEQEQALGVDLEAEEYVKDYEEEYSLNKDQVLREVSEGEGDVGTEGRGRILRKKKKKKEGEKQRKQRKRSKGAAGAGAGLVPGEGEGPGAVIGAGESGGENQAFLEALAKVGDGRIFLPEFPESPEPPQAPPSPPPPPPPSGPRRRQGVLAPNAPVTVTVETKRDELNYYISPLIYGVNEYGYSSYSELRAAVLDAGIRLVRRGGNADTRYNWLYETRGSASDWYFENFPMYGEGNYTSVDMLHTIAKQGGGEALFTIPVLGWLPKGRDRNCSFSIKKYGPQKSFDPWNRDCGNGVYNDTGKSIQNDVTDAAALFGPDHQKRFVETLVSKWGDAASGGVRYYCLDNEPVWWSYVHRDIHPNPSTYNEILERHLAYAAAVKKADPTAVVLGPVSGGWSDIFFSITDMQYGWGTRPWKFWANPVDRKRHGDVPHLQWYLENMAAYEAAYGTRLLDVVDIHAYIAGNYGDESSDPKSQANRVAATRIYWDPTFRCNDTICDWCDPYNAPEGIPRLLVRVQEMINKAYPGLGIAVTEYSHGGRKDASGAVAQAETLGIFGKLRIKMATVFSGPKAGTSVYQAFKMFGNYDNNGAQFGNLAVNAVTSNYTAVSAYAAINYAQNALTVLLINLTPSDQQVTLNLLDVSPTQPIKYYRYDSSNLTAILPMPPFAPTSSLVYTYSGYSLNMLEVPLS